MRAGEGEEEAAALAGFAFSPDTAAVLFDDAAAEGQAQAGAAQCTGIGGVALLEAVEDAFQFFRSDAAALVFDDEADGTGAGGAGALGTEAGGVCPWVHSPF